MTNQSDPQPPMAVITGPSNVNENTTITLSGSNITGETILSYQWEQISPSNGITAQIKSPRASSTDIVLPYLKNINLSEPFVFQLTVVGAGGANSTNHHLVVTSPANIDSDGDGLIDIRSLLMLHNMRYNLTGTSYKTNDSDTGLTTGCPSDTCSGYELLVSLNFDQDGDGSTWTESGGTYTLDSGDSQAPYFDVIGQGGWQPIGDDTAAFRTTFEGNGHTLTGLAIRRTLDSVVGFFGRIDNGAIICNVGLLDNLVVAPTVISISSFFGGLVGRQTGGNIVATYTTGPVDTGENGDFTGGLVGLQEGGNIVASYATGNVNGRNLVGGLVAQYEGGNIIASYATGNVNGGGENNERVGGLLGLLNVLSTDFVGLVASYATGNVNGEGGSTDNVGALVGAQGTGSLVASFGFGTTMNGRDHSFGTSITNSAWTPQTALALTLAIVNDPNDVSGNPDDNKWDSASDSTKGAWDFGTSSQIPALKYADYDGTGTMFHCDSDAANAPTGAILIANCGELIPGQR